MLFKMHLVLYLSCRWVGGGRFQLALLFALLNMRKVASKILLRYLFVKKSAKYVGSQISFKYN